MAEPVTVAIPVRNGGSLLDETLVAVRAQELDRPIELLVADSASTDGSREVAARHGAAVIDVPPGSFSHGGTRNLLAGHARGTHIAFLTQDAVPATRRWLADLLRGFDEAPDVALVFGPYRPRPGASHMVRRELTGWFRSLSPEGTASVDRGVPVSSDPNAVRHLFFTDANGCIAREAWERVPFREVAYAEDHVLARDMLAAGYAKVFQPPAAVIHSHDYAALQLFRRSFDEWRGLREVHRVTAPASPARNLLAIQREVRDDLRFLRSESEASRFPLRATAASAGYHAARAAGAALGSRAGSLPAGVRRICSLERRDGFRPLEPFQGTSR